MSIMLNFPHFGSYYEGNKIRLYSAKLLNIENEYKRERASSYESALSLLQYVIHSTAKNYVYGQITSKQSPASRIPFYTQQQLQFWNLRTFP